MHYLSVGQVGCLHSLIKTKLMSRFRAQNKVCKITSMDSTCFISSPNPMFDHLLELESSRQISRSVFRDSSMKTSLYDTFRSKLIQIILNF